MSDHDSCNTGEYCDTCFSSDIGCKKCLLDELRKKMDYYDGYRAVSWRDILEIFEVTEEEA